ncbi:hypothetical protein BV25DRAFT_1821343 [Artomyces pyxidatus]|uniref:Uncharacterized protein n=1 Tax=Artomyces pyxidatus TaxID=48021 RepID=A0ACB8TA49_9AGAM|nr:hypothetical protein BV25DRAFT_1821343 [Artomyces pyxidatus]
MSAPPVFIPIPANIASITAPILLGTLFNWCLFGVLVVQVYVYSYYFPDDRRVIKGLVYTVLLFESLQTAFTGADIYYWFAEGFGDLFRLQDPYISPFDIPFMSALIAFIIQTFFCYRIWVLKKSLWWLCFIIIAVSLTQCVGGVAGGIRGHIYGRFSAAHRSIVLVYLWLIGDAVAEFMIAVTMTYLLARSRRNEHRLSNHILSRLMRQTVETNVVSASIAILSLVMFVSAPNNGYYYCPTAVIGKIYSNTLLVTLNNRISLRDAAHRRMESTTSQGGSVSDTPAVNSSNSRPVLLNTRTASFQDQHSLDDLRTKPALLTSDLENGIHLGGMNVRPLPSPPVPAKDYFGLA